MTSFARQGIRMNVVGITLLRSGANGRDRNFVKILIYAGKLRGEVAGL